MQREQYIYLKSMTFEAEARQNIEKFSSYLKENKTPLQCKDQPVNVIQEDNHCLF
jgi:ABC-type Fe2+-enterobactin transport system substrate-binding protein